MKTKEEQYTYLLNLKNEKGLERLGMMMSGTWGRDPKRLAFVLSRYKFVAKMLSGYGSVLELGCGDAWASRVVAQTVSHLTVSDFDPHFLNDAKERSDENWPVSFLLHDMLVAKTTNLFDAIYLLDVFEHINKSDEDTFLSNLCLSLSEYGCSIIGMPSIESQAHIPIDRRDPGHVNCKTGEDLKKLLLKYFHNVFLFSMNDEVVHTGYSKMANYLICLCCSPKKI